MKTVLLLMLVLLLPATGAAKLTSTETCAVTAKLAKGIAERRQDGFPMQAMVEEAEEQDGPLKALALHLIQEAYDTPRFRTTEAKERGIVEFTNAAYADCYRIVSKNQ